MLYDIKNFNKRQDFNQGFWDDFTNRDVMKDYRVSRPNSAPSVNILHADNEYQIELIAPGLCQENYEIEVHDNILEVRSHVDAPKNDNRVYARREYYADDFERSFVLPENAQSEKISASCSDGILTVHVPVRREEKDRIRRTIEIK